MAFLFAAEAAQQASATALQYHGGYGYAEEYDIQLYYRRARGWALQAGDPTLALPTSWPTGLLPEGGRPDGLGTPATCRGVPLPRSSEFIAEHLTPEVLDATTEGTIHHWGFHRELAAARLAERGGARGTRRRGPRRARDGRAHRRAAAGGRSRRRDGRGHRGRLGHPRAGQRAPAIDRRSPAGRRSRRLVSFGYTEPDSGSDVAAAQTKAVRDGDDWVITGQKMWTTLAHEADYVLAADPDQPGRSEASRSDDVRGPPRHAWYRDPARPHHGPRAIQRHVLRRGADR